MNNIHVLKYHSQNLGDDIQSIAVMDILQDLYAHYTLVDRDLINGYFFNPLDNNYIIFNGWFTNGYGLESYYNVGDDIKSQIQVTWPPKGNFIPVLYSFHISEWGPIENREVHPKFLDQESIDFYKRGKAVGCRDTHTLNIMHDLEVDAYKSGCITLTLDRNKYIKKNIVKNEVVFVDVSPIHKPGIIEKAIKHYEGQVGIVSLTHTIPTHYEGILDRFTLAKRHLTTYCNAKLVVTSRLHVALPCLAFGTPVLFVHDEIESKNSRIVDYLPFLNTINYEDIEGLDLSTMTDKYDEQISVTILNQFRDIIGEINDTSNT